MKIFPFSRLQRQRRGAFFALSVAVLCVLFSAPVSAQGVFDMGMLTSTLSVDHVTQSEQTRASAINSKDIARMTEQQLAGSVKKRFKPDDTRFKPSLQNRQNNLARIVRQTEVNNPETAKKLQELFARVDIIAEIGKGLAPYGLRTDMVADAYATYWMVAWKAVHKDNKDLTLAQVAAVRQQSADILMNSEAFASSDDPIKQQLAEVYLLQAGLIQAVASEAQKNVALQQQLVQAVKNGASTLGLVLDNMTLTEKGFVRTKMP